MMKDFRENIWKQSPATGRWRCFFHSDEEAKAEVERLLHKEPGAEDRALERLTSTLEWGGELPIEVFDYIKNFLGQETIYLNKKGPDVHPFALIGLDDLSIWRLGYSEDKDGKPLKGWKEQWLIIGTQGGDPFIVDLNQRETLAPVYHAQHGIGAWKWEKISRSIKLFIREELSFKFYVNRSGELDVKRESF